jgi:SAM-dependent methyltransferase
LGELFTSACRNSSETTAIFLDFSQRADLREFPEMMDQPCSYPEMHGCLRSIESVNRLTRAYFPTLNWLNHVYTVMPRQLFPVHIVDVGCGGGDMLRRIRIWAQERNLPVVLTGIDLNPDAIRAAREVTVPNTITFLAGRAQDFHPPGGIDIVISSLLTHHLEDREIVDFLDWMESTARLGWFINDLHRHRTPYYGFRLLSVFSGWHPFVKHDGAISILRSFRREDWQRLCRAAALPEDFYLIKEYWPARLCVARVKENAIGKRAKD